MKFLKKLSCAAAVALSFAGAAHAGPVLNDWKFNPLGTGVSNASNVHEYLDVVGNAFIQLTATGANSFSFKETAVFYVPGIDGTPFDTEMYPNGNANITATFTAFGTGSFNGAFTFAGGTINLYQDNAANYGSTAGFYGANDGKLIASFDVLNAAAARSTHWAIRSATVKSPCSPRLMPATWHRATSSAATATTCRWKRSCRSPSPTPTRCRCRAAAW
jgi:hypothetical protein